MTSRPIATTRSVMDVPTGRLAMWWVLASETVIFGGLLGSYIMMRLRHGAWADQAANTNTWTGAFNTLVLLTSSLSAVLAHQAAERANGPKAARLLRYTILGGGDGAAHSSVFARHGFARAIGPRTMLRMKLKKNTG